MPDYASRKRLRKKVLDRWENEGGMIPGGQTKTLESGSPDSGASEDDTRQTSENAAAQKGETAAKRNTNQSK